MPNSHQARRHTHSLALMFLFAFVCTATNCLAVDKKDKKDEPKVVTWVEVRTPHFVVASDGGEKTARRFAEEFEALRSFIRARLPQAHTDNGIPIQIMAAKDEKGFATLFFEFPVDKRRIQPAGLFLPRPEKTYVGLRANAFGQAPYEDIFQQYARSALSLSYRNLPPWLEEGYVGAFGGLLISDKSVRMSAPDPDDLSKLYQSPLLPLEIIFKVDRNSPYYNAGNKQTMFFAQSRALVNYLMTDPATSRDKLLERFIIQVESGSESVKAARQIFGDFDQLQNKLDAFVKRIKPGPSEPYSVEAADTASPPRNLSPAELEVRMGDLAAFRGRTDSGRAKIEHALELEPSLEIAHQSLGYVLLHQGELEDAEKNFQQATELDPKDPLSFYGLAMVAKARGGFIGVPLAAVQALEKAVSLNPDFAEAWYNLATIYDLRDETQKEALNAAQQAAALAPGVQVYLELVSTIRDSSKGPKPVQRASTNAPAQQPQVAVRTATSVSPGERSPRLEAKTEGGVQPAPVPPAATATRVEPAPAPAPKPPAETIAPRIYSMTGTIATVSCADSPQIKITLKAQTIEMHLHSGDIAHLTIKSAQPGTQAKGGACTSLRGRNARVSYTLVSDKAWDGEIETIELRNEP
jgi:tetratricopeptide (TPR) repeat protein